jgi:hypothetical protein
VATKKSLLETLKSTVTLGLLGLLFCAFFVAVWSGGPAPIPVSGTVTYQGKPLANFNVICIGKGGVTATGTTDTQGRFPSLTTNAPGDGAFPGAYSVAIAPVTTPSDPKSSASYEMPARPPFPIRYLSTETSPLTISVKPSGENTFHLELQD